MLNRTVIIGLILLGGCSSLDFFSYRENTGLMAVKKPSGYGSIRFGANIAVSGTPDSDYMAISGGEGEQVVFYRLTDNDRLTNVDSPWKRYPVDSGLGSVDVELVKSGTGASLQGLPVFYVGNKQIEGALAMGEPKQQRVKIYRPEIARFDDIKTTADNGEGFGKLVTGIPPRDAGQWLLVAASDHGFEVISAASSNSGRAAPVTDIGGAGETISALTAGRIVISDTDERLFVAVTTTRREQENHLHLFASRTADGMTFDKLACLADTDDKRFGEALAVGDLDGDGTDELLTGAPAKNAVRVFDVLEVAKIAETTGGCLSVPDEAPPATTVTPKESEWDIECKTDCEFGAAIAVGDIATDNNGPELIVGAPGATVEGKEGGGAVYVFRGFKRGDGDTTIAGGKQASEVIPSSPKAGRKFGGAVTVAPMAGRNELLVGAPGGGTVYIAFCTGVGEDIEAGADVTRNGDGKVVSTRCRR